MNTPALGDYTIATIAPTPAGAKELFINQLIAGPLLEPGQSATIALPGVRDEIEIRGTTDPDRLTLVGELLAPIEIQSGARITLTVDARNARNIANRAEELAKMRAILARSQAQADQTETARGEAERAHASSVADSMLANKPVPPKPASLSTLQAADDSADAALAEVERRVATAAAELQAMVYAEGMRRMGVEYKRAGEDGRAAIRAVVAALVDLSDAVGTRRFNALVADLQNAAPAFRDRATAHDQRMSAIRSFLGETRCGVFVGSGAVDGSHDQLANECKWPEPADVRLLIDRHSR